MTTGTVGGTRQVRRGTLRVWKESGHALTKVGTIRHETQHGNRERNVASEESLGQEKDTDPGGMTTGPRWEVSPEKIS